MLLPLPVSTGSPPGKGTPLQSDLRQLQEQTAILAQFPESGAFPQDRMLKSSGFRFLTHKDYLLLYRYERAEGRVYIMAIFHGRRDYLRVMQQYL